MFKKPVEVDVVREFLNMPVSSVTYRERMPKSGELFGLEFELEGKKLSNPEFRVTGWTPCADGSLRGETNIEWVFSSPCTYEQSIKRVENLFAAIDKSGATVNNSYRASTHVHLNYSDKMVYQVVTLFTVYTLLEDILCRWCGEHRRGNLFCMSVRDAENIMRIMENSFERMSFAGFGNEVRYAGLNLCSLNKFGTVEIRIMRGVDKSDEALEWLEICNQLYQFSLNNKESPSQLLEKVSELGSKGFIYEIFSKDVADKLIGKLSELEVHQSLYDGIRVLQMFAYSISNSWRDLKDYVKVEPKSKKKDVIEEEVEEEPLDDRPPAPRGRAARPVDPFAEGQRVYEQFRAQAIRPREIGLGAAEPRFTANEIWNFPPPPPQGDVNDEI